MAQMPQGIDNGANRVEKRQNSTTAGDHRQNPNAGQIGNADNPDMLGPKRSHGEIAGHNCGKAKISLSEADRERKPANQYGLPDATPGTHPASPATARERPALGPPAWPARRPPSQGTSPRPIHVVQRSCPSPHNEVKIPGQVKHPGRPDRADGPHQRIRCDPDLDLGGVHDNRGRHVAIVVFRAV